jgi:hypothetical protein
MKTLGGLVMPSGRLVGDSTESDESRRRNESRFLEADVVDNRQSCKCTSEYLSSVCDEFGINLPSYE